MNANQIAILAKSIGFTSVSDKTYDGSVIVWLYQRGRFSATADDGYLRFKAGFVYGPEYLGRGWMIWSERECSTVEAVRAELMGARADKHTSLHAA